MSDNLYVVKCNQYIMDDYRTHFIVKAKNKKEAIDLIFTKEFHSRNFLAKQQEVKPIRKCDLSAYQLHFDKQNYYTIR